jgi:hypothetical protein
MPHQIWSNGVDVEGPPRQESETTDSVLGDRMANVGQITRIKKQPATNPDYREQHQARH